MLSVDQILRNKQTLTGNLVAAQGLPLTDQGTPDFANWSYDQRIAFNRAFANYVLSHPLSFGDDDAANAQRIVGEHPSQLSDTSVSSDLSAFGSGVLDNVAAAGDSVAGIGEGVLNLAGWAKWLIPVAGVALLVFFLMGAKRKLA